MVQQGWCARLASGAWAGMKFSALAMFFDHLIGNLRRWIFLGMENVISVPLGSFYLWNCSKNYLKLEQRACLLLPIVSHCKITVHFWAWHSTPPLLIFPLKEDSLRSRLEALYFIFFPVGTRETEATPWLNFTSSLKLYLSKGGKMLSVSQRK